MRIIRCEPPIELVKLFAFTRCGNTCPLARRIAHIARETSPFAVDMAAH